MTAQPQTYVPTVWRPLGANHYYAAVFPPAGSVIAFSRGVFRVASARYKTEVEWDDGDRREYERLRRPKDWRSAPYRLELEYLGGVRPEDLDDDETECCIDVHPEMDVTWWVYPHGRWAKCSCCGEPMPCRAELNDLRVDAAMEKIEDMAARLPGCCWACGEPVTQRQRSVTFAGPNLDLPTGPAVMFHLRQDCRWKGEEYEAKWLAADPDRKRILTWPTCRGRLYWHADGTSECRGGEEDCRGWDTHDHGGAAGCKYMDGGCPKGCPPGQSYVNPTDRKRPLTRPAHYPQGNPGNRRTQFARTVPSSDLRRACPGMLVVHRDGSTECIAGGLDDCWGGDTYKHSRSEPCTELNLGCPKCETGGGLA